MNARLSTGELSAVFLFLCNIIAKPRKHYHYQEIADMVDTWNREDARDFAQYEGIIWA